MQQYTFINENNDEINITLYTKPKTNPTMKRLVIVSVNFQYKNILYNIFYIFLIVIK